jgi:general secretion pathway protein G
MRHSVEGKRGDTPGIPARCGRTNSTGVSPLFRRRSQAGLTLVELIVAFSILLILTTMAVPLARYQVRRQREKDLLYDLREMREAINKYKDLCDQGKIQAGDPDAFCYPPKLELLVEGVKMTSTLSGNGQTNKVKFLRRVPKDPMTGDTDWGKRSMQDDPTSNSWGGQNVFNVYTKTMDRASDGTAYSEW